PCNSVILKGHAEAGFIGDFRGRNVGKHVVQTDASDILLQKLGFETGIDAEEKLQFDAAVLDIAQKGDVVRCVTKFDDGIGIRRADIVQQDSIVRRFGRNALVVDDFDYGIRVLDELSD